MAYNWSISTTLRNPDRMIEWLRIARDFIVGRTWNNETQIYFQILLIQYKLYKPTDLTAEEKEKFEDFESVITFEEAEIIFNRQNYESPAMRGRNSFSPLRKFGLVKYVDGVVQITSSGEYLLSDDYDFGYFLFRVFLKWEYANPSERDNSTFNINPFIGTLHLINEVNKIATDRGERVKGISRDEFMIFVQTLTDYERISEYANELYGYRIRIKDIEVDPLLTHQEKEEQKRNEKLSALELITGESDQIKLEKLLKNLKDYSDNTIRYFRSTRYLYIRGGGYYIDLEPRRRVEIDLLLNSYDGSSSMLEDEDVYIDYLSDLNQPVLPWETTVELFRIIDVISVELNELEIQLEIVSIDYSVFKVSDVEVLKSNIQMLRDKRKEYLDLIVHRELQDVSKIEECIYALEHIRELDNKPSIELERWTTRALHALNDSLLINPNYPVGDDNEPLFTAPAGKPDIECFYNSFNSICEVTMLTGRDQWYNEGQPVMRHLRSFETTNNSIPSYCIFVAPRLHTDTINTFWTSTKYEYEGVRQNIIPLTISQLVELLKILIEVKRGSGIFTHLDMKFLLDEIVGITNSVANSREWLARIPESIENWKARLVA